MTADKRVTEGSLLRVQTVLYGGDLAAVWRLVRALNAAARHAVGAGLVQQVEWALGDSSPAPAFGETDARAASDGAEHLAAVTYEFFGANRGSGGGQNHLAAGHPSEFLMVLNPDTYPSPTSISEMLRALAAPDVGIVEARQIPLEHPKVYDPLTGDTGWASGACMMLRRSIFDQFDGFDDEHFLLHCDDVDFSWRVRAGGYRVVVAPLATVFHDKRVVEGESWPAPAIERYHAVLGRLMLATRWGRPDIVTETMETVDRHGSEGQQQAVVDYLALRADGKVPEPLADSSVAEFVDGEYAVHRF